MTLATFLKTKREAAGITQTEISKNLGHQSSQFISNIERGISRPPVGALKTIAKTLSIDLGELKTVYSKDCLSAYETELATKLGAI